MCSPSPCQSFKFWQLYQSLWNHLRSNVWASKPLQRYPLLIFESRFNYYTSYPNDRIFLKTLVSMWWDEALLRYLTCNAGGRLVVHIFAVHYHSLLTDDMPRVLDTTHMSFVIIMIYHYTVTHWGDPLALAETTWFVGSLSKDFQSRMQTFWPRTFFGRSLTVSTRRYSKYYKTMTWPTVQCPRRRISIFCTEK